MKLRFFFILTLLLLSQPLLAADLAKPGPGAPVDLEADQLDFDQATGRYHAQGNVRLTQGPLLFTGDQLWWNQQTGEVDARGQVHFSGPGEELNGQRITYDLQKGTGVVEDGEAFWPEKSLHMTGQRLERVGAKSFRLYDGRVTVCDGEKPAWSVGARQADVTIDRYFTAKHAIVYLKDVPVFYSPYLMIPIKSERESGFLMPSLGFSDTRGTEISTAWYQVLGRNMDATFFLDEYTSLGTGVGLEYRYVFGNKQRGTLNTYTVLADDGSNKVMLDWKNFGQLTESLRLVADVEYVNDNDFFSDYSDVTGVYNQQQVISSIFLNQVWDKASLTGQYKSIKDLESDGLDPWQSAPLVDFSIAPVRLKSTPLYVGLQSSYTRFARDKGETGTRLMVRPTLAFQRYLFNGLELNSEYGYRQRRYIGVDKELISSTGNADFQTRLSGRVTKVFGSGASRWQHSVEPEVNYIYIEENQGTDLPNFDFDDQVAGQNSPGYALVNRLTGKWVDPEGVETSREVVWLKLSQNFSLNQLSDDNSQASPLHTELILRPFASSALNLDAFYDFDQKRIPFISVAGQIGDGKGNKLTLNYLKSSQVNNVVTSNNINVGVDFALLKPLYLGYEQRYDFLESTSLERVVTLDLRQQCWGIKAVFREREAESSVMLTLTLSGIGQVGQFGQKRMNQ